MEEGKNQKSRPSPGGLGIALARKENKKKKVASAVFTPQTLTEETVRRQVYTRQKDKSLSLDPEAQYPLRKRRKKSSFGTPRGPSPGPP